MIEIKKVCKKDIQQLMENPFFWSHPFLSISKHRLMAHAKNPNADNEDIVLLLGYIDNELLGYMGLYIDKINIDGSEKKIGWLSTWWVHPKTKGSGIGREILNTMYDHNNGQIGISQFTPSAKRVYDKSGYFTPLKTNIGVKAVLRSNLSFVIPALFPKLKRLSMLYLIMDSFFNIMIECKLLVHKHTLKNRLKNIRIEYLNTIDNDTQEIIKQHSKKDISHKSMAFYEWLKAYPWILKAPLIKFTENDKYEFSMYDKEFELSYIKIIKQNHCIGLIVLQKRNFVSKVLFTYFEKSDTQIIADIIKLQNISQDTREIICYDEFICNHLKKSSIFLYKRKKVKQSIISKVFGKTDFNDTRMNYGDGDCCFA